MGSDNDKRFPPYVTRRLGAFVVHGKIFLAKNLFAAYNNRNIKQNFRVCWGLRYISAGCAQSLSKKRNSAQKGFTNSSIVITKQNPRVSLPVTDPRGLRYVSAVGAQSLSSKRCLSTSQMIRTMTSTTIFFISSRISSIVITSFPDLRDRCRITTAALYNRRKDLSNKKAPATSRGFRVSETRKIIRQLQFNRDWRRHVQDFFQEARLGRAVGDGEIFFGAVKHFGD